MNIFLAETTRFERMEAHHFSEVQAQCIKPLYHVSLKLTITEYACHSVKISLSQLFPNLPSELYDHDIPVLGLIKWSVRQDLNLRKPDPGHHIKT